jgi:single-strand DNA-binding protein
LTRDPEVRYSDNGHTVARFAIAVDRRFKRENEQNSDFINTVAFGKTAEFVEKYFFQGNKIVVEGRIQTGSYTNQDGQKIYTTDVVAEQVEFGESKNSNNTNGPANESRPAPSSAIGDGFMNIPDGVEDEGLPFN